MRKFDAAKAASKLAFACWSGSGANPMTYLRKRPRQARSQATFDAIIEASARILVEDGTPHLSTNRIADRAGVSVGSLYQYFPNRRAIVRALIEREVAQAEAMRPAILDDLGASAEARIRAAIDWHFDVHAARPALAHALRTLAASILPKEDVQRFAQLRLQRTARTIASINRGGLDIEMATFIVATCLDALSATAARRRPTWLASERFRAEVARLLQGYLAR